MRKKIKALRLNSGIVIGGILFLILLFLSIGAPLFTSQDPVAVNMKLINQPPSAEHIFGTDAYGRDVLARCLYGGRVSFKVGVMSVLCTTVLGTILGLSAGYFRKVDIVVMRIIDGMTAFPAIVLGMALVAVFGQEDRNLILALAIVYTPGMTRIVRSSVLSVRESEYIEAAKAIGANSLRIQLRHILPNIVSPLIVQVTLIFGYAVLAEAGLSYLGLGTQPPSPSWGNILNEGRSSMVIAPWLTTIPGAFIFMTVLSLNLLGDGLRDRFDPKLKR